MWVSRLQSFCLEEKSADSFYLWLKGSKIYGQKLLGAYPQIKSDLIKLAKSEKYDYRLILEHTAPEVIEDVKRCLWGFHRTLWMVSELDNCFALGWHSRRGQPGKPELTTLGQWIHLAKSYSSDFDSAGSLPVAGLIAEQMVEFIKRVPLYSSCQGVVSVLPSNPEKAFDLPARLAELIEEDANIPFLKQAIYKTRLTAQMKHCWSLEDKLDNVQGSIGVNVEMVKGKHIILVDDIFESGMTLGETARVLREQGAQGVHGLVATKTLRCKFK